MKNSILFLLLVLSPLFFVNVSLAEEMSISSGDDVMSFQHMVYVPANDFLVPTVAEVSFPEGFTKQPYFLVLDATSRLPVASYWHSVSTVQSVAVTATRNQGVPARRLVDKLTNTSEVFDLPADGQGSADIYLNLAETKTISSLTFTFEKNVVLPDYISIDTLDKNDTKKIVLAETTMTGSSVSFPAIFTDNLKIKLAYSQPLRISEVTIGEDNRLIKKVSGLRFLAQPGASYVIYFNPDRVVSPKITADSNLRNDSGVVLLEAGQVQKNPLFKREDSDGDGVIDIEDNCIELVNPTQSDIDGNGVGDECDDYDRDGVINATDNCPNLGNRNQRDEDGDMVGDVCDDEESRFTEKYYWILWVGLGMGFMVLGALFWIVLRRDPNLEVNQ